MKSVSRAMKPPRRPGANRQNVCAQMGDDSSPFRGTAARSSLDRGIRIGGSTARPTVGSPPMSARLAVESLAARAASKLSRLAGAGGGTTLPGKLLWKLDPSAIDALAARLRTALLSSPRRTARRRRPPWPPRSSSRAPPRLEPLGREPRLRGGVDAPDAAWRRAGLLEVDEGALPEVAAAYGQAPCCSAISSAISSIATAKWSTSPSAGVQRRPALPAETVLVVNGDDPQVGDLGRERVGHDRLWDRRPATRPADASARRRLALLRPLRAALRVRCRVRRAPRRLSLPRLRPRAAVATGACDRDRARRAAGRLVPARDASGVDAAPAAAPWPLQRLQRPRGRRTRAGRSARRSTRSGTGLERFGAAFGRFERIAAGDKTMLVLLIKNPAGANEVVHTLQRGRGALTPVRRIERRDRGRKGRVVDLGRRLRAVARPHRAADRVR